MTTYAALVTEIRSDLHRGSDFDTRIKAAICAAIRHYRTERFKFNTQRSDFATSASAEFYDLSSINLIEMDLIRLDDNRYRDVLVERTFDWIDEQPYPSNTGRPTDFAIQQGELRLYPIPDRTYSLVLVNHFEMLEVSLSASDLATNAWMTEGFDLVKLHAMADLHANYIRAENSTEEAVKASTQEDVIFKNLKKRANRLNSTGRVRPYTV